MDIPVGEAGCGTHQTQLVAFAVYLAAKGHTAAAGVENAELIVQGGTAAAVGAGLSLLHGIGVRPCGKMCVQISVKGTHGQVGVGGDCVAVHAAEGHQIGCALCGFHIHNGAERDISQSCFVAEYIFGLLAFEDFFGGDGLVLPTDDILVQNAEVGFGVAVEVDDQMLGEVVDGLSFKLLHKLLVGA